MKVGYCFLFLIFIPYLTGAQSANSVLDSLRNELAHTRVDSSRVQIMFWLSVNHTFQHQDSARWYARQGIRLARKANYIQGELDNRDALAFTYSEQNIPYFVQLTLENLQLAKQVNNRAVILREFVNLGLTQFFLENYQQAIPYYHKAKQIAQEDNSKRLGQISLELGLNFLSLHKIDSARFYLTLATSEDATLQEDPYFLYLWGRLVEAQKNPTKAKGYFRQSLQKFTAQQDLRGQGYVYRWFSELLWTQNQPDSSILMAKNGLRVGQIIKNARIVFYNSRLLTGYYQSLAHTDSAYKYQTIMVAASDSLFSQQRINQVQGTLIEEQQRAQRLEEAKIQLEGQVRTYGLLAIVSLLVLVAGMLYRNNLQKYRTNRQLLSLNEEIEQQKEAIESQRDHLEQTLTELQTTQNQLIQKEKLASLGELTAGIAHEIQNPLNFVNNFSEVSTELVDELEEEVDAGRVEEVKAIAGDLRQNLEKITHHGKRAGAIIKGMLEHSRASTGERTPTDLNALADEYLRLAYHGLKAKDKSFNAVLKTDFDESLNPVNMVAQDIGRVLLNLYTNAFYAVQQQQQQANTDQAYLPTVQVSTHRLGNMIEIRVNDNGTGIPESVKEKIFQPFFTTKPTGEGTGLGLSLTYDIVTKGHDGRLTVESQEGQGSEFTIHLPAE